MYNLIHNDEFEHWNIYIYLKGLYLTIYMY